MPARLAVSPPRDWPDGHVFGLLLVEAGKVRFAGGLAALSLIVKCTVPV
jgi:hypothetical protein